MGGRFKRALLLAKKGQKRDLGFGVVAVFRGSIEAHIIDDSDEPVPIVEIKANCLKDGLDEYGNQECWIVVHDGMEVMFPNSFPNACREKLMKHLNDAFDAGEDVDDCDHWWCKEGGQKNWPPARETWKDKR